MKLIADIGNTLHKFHFFKEKELINTFIKSSDDDEVFWYDMLKRQGTPRAAIVSSVAAVNPVFTETLSKICKVLLLNYKTPVPLENNYGTPESLGSDRLAAAVGGFVMFPNDPVLVIEAGTCIKYEIVDSGVYSGGIIAPGIQMQASALHTFTGKLPLVKPNPETDTPLTGTTTESALMSGIINTTISSMEGIIGRYINIFPGLKIIIGGGDLNYFVKRLKYSIFAVPNIVALGLNEILDFNENNKEVWFNGVDDSDQFHASQGSINV